MRAFRIPAIALALTIGLAAGCDEAITPTNLDAGGARPAFSENADRLQLLRLNWPDTVTYTVEGIINKSGGSIEMGKHSLVIARGAVKHRTRFVFTAVLGEYLVLDLRAFNVSDGQEVKVFDADVKLNIDYTDLKWLGDPTRMTMVYLADNSTSGRKERVESSVDSRKHRVSGRLKHFSWYSIAVE